MQYVVQITNLNQPEPGYLTLAFTLDSTPLDSIYGGSGIAPLIPIPISQLSDPAQVRANILAILTEFCAGSNMPAPASADVVILSQLY